jgi:hypothetical protein
LVGELRQLPAEIGIFPGFPQLARSLNRRWHGSPRSRKGEFQMSQSPITRTLIAIVAAVATSTVAVGAAVGPAQAVETPVRASLNA